MILAGLVFLAAQAVRAEEAVAPPETQAQAQPETSPCDLKRPGDFAPREQIVSKRNASDYRRTNGVLARAAHEPVMVDTNGMHARRLAMYGGRVFSDSPVVDASASSYVADAPTELPTQSPESSKFWGRVILLGLPVVVFGVFLAWWLRQVKYAEVPKAQIVRLRQGAAGHEKKPAGPNRHARRS